jgi:serine/threonine-protein kinase
MEARIANDDLRELPRFASWVLLGSSAAATLLALFQWMQLMVVRSGGRSVCGINETINCETVWSSEFASGVHRLVGLPVAGMGMVWGLTAFAASIFLVLRARQGFDSAHPERRPIQVPVATIRIASAVGLLSLIPLAIASFRAGAVCLTCLGTFVTVIAFGAGAWLLLPGPYKIFGKELWPAVGWVGGFAAIAYLALLGPGLSTPRASTALGKIERTQEGSDDEVKALKNYLSSLPAAQKQAVADALEVFRRSPTPDISAFRVRARPGPATAPVRFVEFTDIRCSHCALLLQVMKQIEQAVPPGRISIEARHFPLDAACNPAIRISEGTGIRCLGAKSLICLEGTPEFWDLREKMFAEQESLTPERILQIASSGSMKRSELEACIGSPQTTRLLNEDIVYAMQYSPEGTPLVLINGREAPAVGPFLLVMAMAEGKIDSPAFAGLPRPRPRAAP